MRIAIFSSRRLLVPAASYVVVSFHCTQLPLLNYLGYEFSAVIALLATFIAGFSTIKSVRHSLCVTDDSQFAINNSHLRPSAFATEATADRSDFGGQAQFEIPGPQSPSTSFRLRYRSYGGQVGLRRAGLITHHFHAFTHSLATNLLLLLLPLAIISLNAFFVKNCSWVEGFGFYLLIPVVAVVFSCGLGFFCAVHYRWSKTIFVLIFLATIAYALALGYFTPAIFSYNFFYGYFPGLTYDEVLGISSSLVLFRVFTLILAAALVWMTMLLLKNTYPFDKTSKKGVALLGAMVQGKNVIIAGVIATLLIVTWYFRSELGFDSSSKFIQKQLGERFETEHFVIFYSQESYDDEELRWVAAEHEFRLNQIAKAFSLSFKGRIESYIYPSSEIKQRLMGAGNTNIAKPWSGQIHITKQSLDATLKHELVHVIAAPFGLPIIKASVSTGLVEGVAMAIEWDWGNRSLHQYAAAMRKFGVGPDIGSLMTITGFASQASSISYVLAGSFCRYLIDEYGIRNMMLLYRSNDYEKIYSKPLSVLIREWQGFLEKISVEDRDRDAVDVLFRRPAIFQKVCARVIAGRNRAAARLFGLREYKAAADLYYLSFEDGHGYDALSGFITSALHARNFGGVSAAFDSIIARSEKPAQYVPLYVNVGVASAGQGQFDKARELFNRVEAADLGTTLNEAAVVSRAALDDSLNRDRFLTYFLSAAGDSQRVVLLDSMIQHPVRHWLPIYLKARVLTRLQRWEEALAMINLLEPGISNRKLEAIRLRTLGFVLFRLLRFEDAKVTFWRSLNSVATDVATNEVYEWVERCEWMKTNF